MRLDTQIIDKLRGRDQILDSKWCLNITDRLTYPDDWGLRIQANGVYKRVTKSRNFKSKIGFGIVFYMNRRGSKIVFQKISLEGEWNSITRREVKKDLYRIFSELKKGKKL